MVGEEACCKEDVKRMEEAEDVEAVEIILLGVRWISIGLVVERNRDTKSGIEVIAYSKASKLMV